MRLYLAVVTCNGNCVDRLCDGNGICTRGCHRGYWGDKCQNYCPSTCLSRICNSINGSCASCINGFFGDKCNMTCDAGCLYRKCFKDTGNCNECLTGYYGAKCQDRCGYCRTSTCERDSGNCEACYRGYYGKKCNIPCPRNCLYQECRKRDGYCSRACRSGFYGSFCNMSCSENCAQTICSQNGACIGGCKPNWKGNKCDEISCSSSCVDQQCSGTGTCIRGCIPGYWGDKCQSNCHSSCFSCYKGNGLCNSCNDGYYGDKCEKLCPRQCYKQTCNKDTGYCTTGCSPGYYGNRCSSPCGKCSIGVCDNNTGNCEACKTGYYGVKCNRLCGNTCLAQKCRQIDGYCSDGCNSAFYGAFCNLSCSENCVQTSCSRKGICIGGCKASWSGGKCQTKCSSNCVDMKCDGYGNCTRGCIQGYWGDKCQDNCSSKCSNGVCIKSNGFCISCIDGYFGDKCEMNCYWNVKCSGRKCNKTNGFCLNGCNPGFYGNYCDKRCGNCSSVICERKTGNCQACNAGFHGTKCDRKCSTKCLDQECKQINGHCRNGCNSGFYGLICNMPCSNNCALKKCRQNGICIEGCKPNWTGDKCNRCDSNHYGSGCLQECSVYCKNGTCNNLTGFCTFGCKNGFYLQKCEKSCSSSCPLACRMYTGECEGECPVGNYGNFCNKTCNGNCKNGCNKSNGSCEFGCIVGNFGADCLQTCGRGCISGCHQSNGSCSCKSGWQGQNCDVCKPDYYGQECEQRCSSNCINGTCLPNNGSCRGGCKGYFVDEQCTMALLVSDWTSLPTTAIGVGLGAGILLLVIIIVVIFLRQKRRQNSNPKADAVIFRKESAPSTAENKFYSTIRNVSVPIEDPEEEPQSENPEDAVYYNDLSVAKDIAVSNLQSVITHKEAKENERFLKEFKSLPYGERFDCDIAKTEKNMPKNRFKTTFPYDHSRVILDASQGFISDYINANYIENMEGKREFIACQGPLKNTLVDHWRMIWQEHVEYIVMLTNLIEGPKVKCHQYWPDKETELDINPFSVTLVEEKQYAYFVERRLTLRNKKVTGSRTVVQYHYTQWPDHGTPNPLNLVVFHRHFRHKIRSTQHPIIVHCSAGIGRTGTFIAFDVLSRYGKDKGKVNVIEYVKAMRKDRMTMIQNVDQYVFLYHALHEFFRGKAHYKKRDEILSLYGDMNKLDAQKQLTNEFNELISLKPRFDSKDFKSGKTFLKLNMTKSVLPVEQYLVYLTSHVPGRQFYYNAVTVSSFTRDDEFISAQFPVPDGAIDLVRLLVDHESTFLISLNPLSELKELQSWVNEKVNHLKLGPYTITKGTQEVLSGEIRKTNITITTKEETSDVEILECLNWSFNDTLPMETSTLTNLIKQFRLYRKHQPKGHVTVLSKDGATCCGVFCAVYNAIEQLQQDDEVDIFTIVQQLQCRRPEMISTKEEYEFCFKVVSDFLNTESVYANT